MKTKWHYIWILLIMLLFLSIPIPASDLVIRITLGNPDGVDARHFYLYYSTEESGFSQDQLVQATYDEKNGTISFPLDASLEGRITSLRLDFPTTEQSILLRSISVSSAGLIQKQYNPCVFLSPANLEAINDIKAIDLIPSRANAYVSTFETDPYLVLNNPFSQEVTGHFSHYFITRILICLFFAVCIYSAQKKFFKE